MKIYAFGKVVECRPTQKALEKLGYNLWNKQLIIKNNTGYLQPVCMFSGDALFPTDNLEEIPKIKLSIWNCIFNNKKYNRKIQIIKRNNRLLALKEEAKNYKLPIIKA